MNLHIITVLLLCIFNTQAFILNKPRNIQLSNTRSPQAEDSVNYSGRQAEVGENVPAKALTLPDVDVSGKPAPIFTIKQKRCPSRDVVGSIYRPFSIIPITKRDTNPAMYEKLCQRCLNSTLCKSFKNCDLCDRWCHPTTANTIVETDPKIFDDEELPLPLNPPVLGQRHNIMDDGIVPENMNNDQTVLSEQVGSEVVGSENFYMLNTVTERHRIGLICQYLDISNQAGIDQLIVFASGTPPPRGAKKIPSTLDSELQSFLKNGSFEGLDSNSNSKLASTMDDDLIKILDENHDNSEVPTGNIVGSQPADSENEFQNRMNDLLKSPNVDEEIMKPESEPQLSDGDTVGNTESEATLPNDEPKEENPLRYEKVKLLKRKYKPIKTLENETVAEPQEQNESDSNALHRKHKHRKHPKHHLVDDQDETVAEPQDSLSRKHKHRKHPKYQVRTENLNPEEAESPFKRTHKHGKHYLSEPEEVVAEPKTFARVNPDTDPVDFSIGNSEVGMNEPEMLSVDGRVKPIPESASQFVGAPQQEDSNGNVMVEPHDKIRELEDNFERSDVEEFKNDEEEGKTEKNDVSVFADGNVKIGEERNNEDEVPQTLVENRLGSPTDNSNPALEPEEPVASDPQQPHPIEHNFSQPPATGSELSRGILQNEDQLGSMNKDMESMPEEAKLGNPKDEDLHQRDNDDNLQQMNPSFASGTSLGRDIVDTIAKNLHQRDNEDNLGRGTEDLKQRDTEDNLQKLNPSFASGTSLGRDIVNIVDENLERRENEDNLQESNPDFADGTSLARGIMSTVADNLNQEDNEDILRTPIDENLRSDGLDNLQQPDPLFGMDVPKITSGNLGPLDLGRDITEQVHKHLHGDGNVPQSGNSGTSLGRDIIKTVANHFKPDESRPGLDALPAQTSGDALKVVEKQLENSQDHLKEIIDNNRHLQSELLQPNGPHLAEITPHEPRQVPSPSPVFGSSKVKPQAAFAPVRKDKIYKMLPMDARIETAPDVVQSVIPLEDTNPEAMENRGDFAHIVGSPLHQLQQDISNNFGKIIPLKDGKNFSSKPDSVFFIGNGIKLPLQMHHNEDGTVDLSVDLDKLCNCKNSTCPKNHTIEEAVGAILEKEAELKDQIASLDETLDNDIVGMAAPTTLPSEGAPQKRLERSPKLEEEVLETITRSTTTTYRPKPSTTTPSKFGEEYDELSGIKQLYKFKKLEEDLGNKLEKLNKHVAKINDDNKMVLTNGAKILFKTNEENVVVQEQVDIINNVLEWMKTFAVSDENF